MLSEMHAIREGREIIAKFGAIFRQNGVHMTKPVLGYVILENLIENYKKNYDNHSIMVLYQMSTLESYK